MTGRVVLLVWLTLVWVALWGDLTAANVASGLVAGGLLIAAFPDLLPTSFATVRPARLLVALGYFLYKLVEANLVVAWEVITPVNRLNQGIVAVPVKGADDLLLTVLANAISLTPGTLTLEVRRNPPTLYVHVMHIRSVEATRRDVLHLERLLLLAFAPPLARQSEPAAKEPGP